MVPLQHLEAFVQSVDGGSFSAAARRLGVSPAAISKNVARLEATLGIRLFQRSTRRLTLTEAGVRFHAQVGGPLAALQEVVAGVDKDSGQPAGTLKVSMGQAFGRTYLVPLLGEFLSHYPAVVPDWHFENRQVDLVGEGFDAAIRIGALKDSSLVARRLAPVRGVVVASPDYLARNGRPRTPRDLTGQQCLIYTGSSTLDWVFRSGKRTIAVRPEGRLRTDNGEVMRQWAIEGLGIAALPSFLASDALAEGKLEAILRDYQMPEAAIYVVRPPGAYVPGKVRVLIDTLAERFGGEPFWDACLMHERQSARR